MRRPPARGPEWVELEARSQDLCVPSSRRCSLNPFLLARGFANSALPPLAFPPSAANYTLLPEGGAEFRVGSLFSGHNLTYERPDVSHVEPSNVGPGVETFTLSGSYLGSHAGHLYRIRLAYVDRSGSLPVADWPGIPCDITDDSTASILVCSATIVHPNFNLEVVMQYRDIVDEAKSVWFTTDQLITVRPIRLEYVLSLACL